MAGLARLIRMKLYSTLATLRILFTLYDEILLPAFWASVADRKLPTLRLIHAGFLPWVGQNDLI